MKKVLKLFTMTLALCLLLTVFAGAKTVSKTYVIEELDVALDLPEDLLVQQREDLAEDALYLEFINADYKTSKNLFLGAVSVREPILTDNGIFDYSRHYEDQARKDLKYLLRLYEKLYHFVAPKGTDMDVDVYENDQTDFIEYVLKVREDGKTVWYTTYTTDVAGQTYVFSFVTKGQREQKTIEKIMDSVRVEQSTWSPSGFDDVAGHWAEAAITEAVKKELFTGSTKTSFRPDAPMTRAMLVQVLYRMEGEPKVKEYADFSDVDEDDWYAKAVSWAAKKEIVTGSDGKFNPDGLLTREQLAAILWRYAKYDKRDVSVGDNTNILSYEDAFDIAEYAIPAFQWTCGSGVMKGVDETHLAPQTTTTRAEVATILVRYLDK